MKIISKICTRNPCYRKNSKIIVRGLMLHSVGCPQPDASVFIRMWDDINYTMACVHGVIDADTGQAYQTLPWNHRGWHCGSGKNGSGNNTHIGVEMCEPSSVRYISGSNFTCSDMSAARAAAKKTYKTAVELFAMLCKKYGLDPLEDGVIISHKEGCARGIASNHGDPEHLWSGLGMGYTMDTFRRAVYAEINGEAVFEAGKIYTATKSCYLRSSAGVKDNKVKYKTLPDFVKKKCRNKFGYAVFKKNKDFRLDKSKYKGGNIWGRIKAGYWVPLIYKKKVRAKEVL